MKLLLSTTISNIIPTRTSLFENLLLRRLILTKEDYRRGGILPMVKKVGLDGVELIIPGQVDKKTIKKIKEKLKENELPVLSVHQPVSLINRIDWKAITYTLNTAREFSADLIVIHIAALGKKIYDSSFLKRLKRAGRDYGIQIGLENMPRCYGRPKEYYEAKIFSRIARQFDFKIVFDTCHLGSSSQDLVNFFQENKDRIINIHLSDYFNFLPLIQAIPKIPFWGHLPLESGNLPIKELLQTLKKENYRGLVTLEILCNSQRLQDSANLVRALTR